MVVDGKAVHKTMGGLFVKSKSEVAVANILHELVDRVKGSLAYERPFTRIDGWPLLPDFTIDLPSGRRIIWEHLGMLDQSTYSADWQAKLEGYLASSVTLWPDESGTNGTLVTSTESVASRGLDTQAIAERARAVIASRQER